MPVSGSMNLTSGPSSEITEMRWLTVAEAVRLMPDLHKPVRVYLAAGPHRGEG